MTNRFPHHVWHQFTEILGHIKFWIISAVIILIAKETPEDWIANFIKGMPARLKEYWPAVLDARTTMVSFAVALVIADITYRAVRDARKSKPVSKLVATLNVFHPEDIHVAQIELKVQNTGATHEFLKSVEFVNKGQWDIPFYHVHTTTEPVVTRLDKIPYIQIGAKLGDHASRALQFDLKPAGVRRDAFVITTDHSPENGAGFFPFHLGCTLVYGDNDIRLPLPDIVVSLHGQAIRSYTEKEARSLDPFAKPGHARANANQAFSRLGGTVICANNLKAALKTLAGAP